MGDILVEIGGLHYMAFLYASILIRNWAFNCNIQVSEAIMGYFNGSQAPRRLKNTQGLDMCNGFNLLSWLMAIWEGEGTENEKVLPF